MIETQNLKVLSNITSPPKWSFGGKPTTAKEVDSHPGPGNYDIKDIKDKHHGPNFTKAKRSNQVYIDTPGPGSYEQKVDNFGPHWSLSQRWNPTKIETSIGPGTYNPKINYTNTPPSFQFGKANRTDFLQYSSSPGPGTYDAKFNDSSYKYSIALKTNKENSHDSTPGPGSYQANDIYKGISYSLRAKVKEAKIRNETPGPGSYQIKSLLGSGIKYSILGKHTNYILKHSAISPGPGFYFTKVDNTKFKFPSYSFGLKETKKQQQSLQVNDFYEVQKNLKSGPIWSFGRESKDNKINLSSSPGPGTYELVEYQLHGPKYTFPHDSRVKFQVITSNIVGPGQYDLNLKPSTPFWKFGSEHRNGPIDSSTFTPGPGSYPLNQHASGPRWTMASRQYSKPIEESSTGFNVLVSSFM